MDNEKLKEAADLIADVLLGKESRQTAKDGSSYDRQRKRMVKEITEHIYGQHKWHLNTDNMFRIFIAGANWQSEQRKVNVGDKELNRKLFNLLLDYHQHDDFYIKDAIEQIKALFIKPIDTDKIKAIHDELEARYDSAKSVHDKEMENQKNNSDFNLRTKESSWGKMVAYNHSKKLISELLTHK